ncbi:MAG: hypothetical protein QG636_677 [Patescibacteria group bacterium]|nr:hypothetical protein [Patescibacteria group bacterium]
MANVSFEEEPYQAPKIVSTKGSGLLGVVIAMGLAKDEKGASAFLLWSAIAGCVLAAGLFTWMYVDRPQGLDSTDIDRIIQLQQ